MKTIKKLEHEILKLKAENYSLRKGFSDIHRYLLLPKFHVDTTVQVNDIILRMSEALDNAENLVNDIENNN